MPKTLATATATATVDRLLHQAHVVLTDGTHSACPKPPPDEE